MSRQTLPVQKRGPDGKRRRMLLSALLALAVVAAVALHWLSQPSQLSGLVLHSLGEALGLEISASGSSEYQLQATPMLAVRDVVVREPGAATPLLRARRVYLSLPWSTLRARGKKLTARRIELDAPQIDLPALQHWLASRPPASETRLPTLVEGLHIRNGVIVGDDWRVEALTIEVPALLPDHPMLAQLSGRYVAPPMRIAFDLATALSRPQRLIDKQTTGFAANGTLALDHGDWRLPMTMSLSGPLRMGYAVQLTPARLGLAARFEQGATRTPFALGAFGPLNFGQGSLTFSNASLALRPRRQSKADPIPPVDARGVLRFGPGLTLQLDGVIAQWPDAWPALPPPLSQSRSPLPFALRYEGPTDLSAITALKLHRDATRFDGRFRLPEVLAWVAALDTGTLIPPIAGTLSAPELQVSGAVLHGVAITFDETELVPPTAISTPANPPTKLSYGQPILIPTGPHAQMP